MTTAVIVMKSGYQVRFACSDIKVRFLDEQLLRISWEDAPEAPLWLDINDVAAVLAEE